MIELPAELPSWIRLIGFGASTGFGLALAYAAIKNSITGGSKELRSLRERFTEKFDTIEHNLTEFNTKAEVAVEGIVKQLSQNFAKTESIHVELVGYNGESGLLAAVKNTVDDLKELRDQVAALERSTTDKLGEVEGEIEKSRHLLRNELMALIGRIEMRLDGRIDELTRRLDRGSVKHV